LFGLFYCSVFREYRITWSDINHPARNPSRMVIYETPLKPPNLTPEKTDYYNHACQEVRFGKLRKTLPEQTKCGMGAYTPQAKPVRDGRKYPSSEAHIRMGAYIFEENLRSAHPDMGERPLFVAQRSHRVLLRRLAGRHKAENNAHGGRHSEGYQHRLNGYNGQDIGKAGNSP
jgi:hypothetical protein